MSTEPLIVPVQLDALVVNKGVLGTHGDFRHWPFNYNALQSFKSPEPPAFSGTTGKPSPGIYLHWNLPRALRSGTQDRPTGKINYPLVPNRWLLVRVHGTNERQCTGWVIESDCPFTGGVKEMLPGYDVARTSQYPVNAAIISAWKQSPDKLRNTVDLDPETNGPQHVNMGIAFPLEGWAERTSGTSFLTAATPGNPAFSIYYAHNTGVFSMHDELKGIGNTSVSYFLTGWYSDAGDDVLGTWQKEKDAAAAYSALLAQLDWKEATAGSKTADRSYYQGMALSIAWDANGAPPANDPLQAVEDSGKLNVSLGNTTVDAFSAMIGKQLEVSGKSTQPAKFLRAFQYDLLPLLNTVNGDALLDERIRQEWFRPEQGGTKWTIATKENSDAPTVLTDNESKWLNELNAQQEKFDRELKVLSALQWQLHAAWWKLGRDPDMSGEEISNEELEHYLDPSNASGITAQVMQQMQVVNGLSRSIPQADWNNAQNPEAALATGINAFAATKKLDASKTLKAVAAPRHWKASDPVMTISGLEPSPAADPDETLTVRYSSELISALNCSGKKADSGNLPKELNGFLSKATLPAVCAPLFTEFLLCDATNAVVLAKSTGIAAKELEAAISAHNAQSYSGTLPSLGLSAWSQPWEPIFAEWQVSYSHIPFGSNDALNWQFNGNDYTYDANNRSADTQDRVVSGVALLSSHPQTLFRRKLKEFLLKYTNTSLDEVKKWIDATDGWKFIAQELTGFHDRLAYRDGRLFRRPNSKEKTGKTDTPLAALAGFSSGAGSGYHAPSVRNVPLLPNGEETQFNGIRHGQMHFERLVVYDKFGRQLWIVERGDNAGTKSAANFPLIRDAAFIPKHPVNTTIPAVAELPPRLLQPARMEFSLRNARTDEAIHTVSMHDNPVGGWIIPDHINRSLLLFDADGKSLGELRLAAHTDGARRTHWQPAPGSTVQTPDQLAAAAPLLHRVAMDAGIASEAAFTAFLHVIDHTLWTIDPLGERDDNNLSVLIGRPLALVRAHMQLQLAGPALRDCSWASTLDPPAPEFTKLSFSIRIGDEHTREDGVIGYFTGNNYSAFSSVTEPTGNQSYIRKTGPGNYPQLKFDEGSFTFFTLLVDPRAGIHAYTGLLPVKQLDIPAACTRPALGAMELNFRTGPVLTEMHATPTVDEMKPAFTNALSIPLPAAHNGTWGWWEKSRDGKSADGFTVDTSFPNTGVKNTANSIREGWLRLTNNPEGKNNAATETTGHTLPVDFNVPSGHRNDPVH